MAIYRDLRSDKLGFFDKNFWDTPYCLKRSISKLQGVKEPLMMSDRIKFIVKAHERGVLDASMVKMPSDASLVWSGSFSSVYILSAFKIMEEYAVGLEGLQMMSALLKARDDTYSRGEWKSFREAINRLLESKTWSHSQLLQIFDVVSAININIERGP